MKPKLPLAVLTVLGLAPLSSVAQFEPYPRGDREDIFSEVSVTFYAEPYFRGESITLPAHTALEDLGDVRFANGRRVDNRISSVWIEGHAHVTLYDRDDFEGDFITLIQSEEDLDLVRQGRHGDWDNETSSISITAHLESMVCEPGAAGGSPYVVVGPPSHRGPSTPYPTGPSHRYGGNRGHDNYGHGHSFRRDPAILRKVERAYRDVLRRSPDRHGRSTYYYTMIERGWSESRLRKELRKSDEYHQQTIPAVVTKVYREVLGREPDPAGFKFYTQKMSREGWYESHLTKALKRSPEYAARGRSSSRPPIHQVTPKPKTPSSAQPTFTSRPVTSSPRVMRPRYTETKEPISKATTRPMARLQPVVTPPPRRVASPPPPRPTAPKVATRNSSTKPLALKPILPKRTQPIPPQSN